MLQKTLPHGDAMVALCGNVPQYFYQGEKMGLRFRRSIKVLPGLRLNVGLRRTSVSFGGRGFIYNIGSKGSRVTVGIPGSGISYTTNVSHQNPANLLANSLPSRRRYSATPLVIAAFVLGLLYIATQSTGPTTMLHESASQPASGAADITGSIAKISSENVTAVDGPIPLPRPRPKAKVEGVGPPLQILPRE
ncbi:DUF4236 domain-containing protein [Rhodopseudomonas sp.]|uniref:DUF4236 domain-containing protein n=1 Tax=Rhodopseudomonas sp. TaxID=1078 RepID=UPI0039C8EAF8